MSRPVDIAEAAEDVAMIQGHLEHERANAWRFKGRDAKAWIKGHLAMRRADLAAAEARLAALTATPCAGLAVLGNREP